MKLKLLLIPVLIIILSGLSFSKDREVKELTSGWKFYKGNDDNAFRVKFDDSAWQNVQIPHDWAITGPFIADGNGDTGKLPWDA